MWNDSESSSDFIDFQHYVAAISGIVDNESLLPCSIGVFGDWGSGKSSLMKMVEEKYSDVEDTLVISFNGWLFEGYEDTKTILMSRIVDEVVNHRKLGEKGIKLAAKLLQRIDIMKLSKFGIKHGLGFLTMGPAGTAVVGANDAIKQLSLADYEGILKKESEVENPDDNLKSSIHHFRENFEELLSETRLDKVVVLIDDLDRCSYDTVIATLEAIKLFLFAKNTAFVLGADERLIKHAVRRRFPEIPGENAEVGRDYLEKLIQHPIRIPPLSEQELTVYLNLLFVSLHVDIGEFEFVREKVISGKNEDPFGFSFTLDNVGQYLTDAPSEALKEALSLSAQVVPSLTVGLNGNPRQAKRFLNALLNRCKMAEEKKQTLNKRVLAKLMLLEYFKPQMFEALYKEQAENGGIAVSASFMEKFANGEGDAEEKLEDWIIHLQDKWILDWCSTEPSIANENLQPYFYFSRDKLSESGVNIRRMSSQAQEVMLKLVDKAESVVKIGLSEVAHLSSGDASAIFEALSHRMKSEGAQSGENPTLKRLCDLCAVRRELISQFLSLIDSYPDQALPITVTTWITELTEGTEHDSSRIAIMTRWKGSKTNKPLATIARKKLDN